MVETDNLGGRSIVSVVVPRPLDHSFTYAVTSDEAPRVRIGSWVKVPFGRVQTHAFVVELPKPLTELPVEIKPESLKNILELGSEDSAVPQDVFSLCKWAHEFYGYPLGEVLNAAVPAASLGLKNAGPIRALHQPRAQLESHVLTEEQSQALAILEKTRNARGVALLNGVTGSGKTELYIELAKRTLSEDRGVLLLVPEIALTSQLHRRFEEQLGVPVGLWHSAMPDGKRRDQTAALRSGELKVIVGARSAVFAPVKNLGLIVVDEEHDPTYKQEDRFRYHARDLAVVRGKISEAPVILGSATPSLETRERVIEGRYQQALLKKRIASGGLPSVEIIDLCKETKIEGTQAILAERTIKTIQDTLDAGEQVIVFLNRRGFASFLLCEDCGEVTECPHCSISLTVHKRPPLLKCHVCAYQSAIPHQCPKCRSHQLEGVGAGTESLEEEFPRLLKDARVLRLDRDLITSTKRLDAALEEFRTGKANLMLGTQMLVKGHDFPGVTLVVVILADGLFRWPDFRAPERAYQILKQVSGRAGRGERPGKVLIQTFDLDHPVIQTIQGFLSEEAFLSSERELRRALGYPPFGRIARLRFEDPNQNQARERSEICAKILMTPEDPELQVLGPSEAFLERAKGIYRWDILLKSPQIKALHRGVYRLKEICLQRKWPLVIDIDPYGTN